ncbi:hypothetical protein [Afifella sp. YEN Y35]|uniref:hypothetical protein n=1 Tax=Afifella sp. YEN Y35 TaxID=3388337 RepID=UPI0039E1ACEE
MILIIVSRDKADLRWALFGWDCVAAVDELERGELILSSSETNFVSFVQVETISN